MYTANIGLRGVESDISHRDFALIHIVRRLLEEKVGVPKDTPKFGFIYLMERQKGIRHKGFPGDGQECNLLKDARFLVVRKLS